MAETIKIGGELESTATGNVVAAASAIKDKVKNKYQGEINAETDASLADRYTKAETYNKTELNNMITTPEQGFVTVTATDETTDVTDVLPATGEADTIYRVGNWDGTQYNDSVFSEYAWNGSAYVKLSTKSQIGEVYDISANHAGATYADLAAALGTNGANIPQSLRKGGMSVKFVQSSDNKYMQFRCMSNEFTTDVAQWQGITEDGSDFDNPDAAKRAKIPTVGAVADVFGEYTNNPKFVEVKMDRFYKLLESLDDNGKKTFYADLETLGKFFAKRLDIDGVTTFVVDKQGYLAALLDNNDRLLIGIKENGDIKFGFGVPTQIKEYIGDLSTYPNVLSFLGELIFGDKTLETLLDAINSNTSKLKAECDYTNLYIEQDFNDTSWGNFVRGKNVSVKKVMNLNLGYSQSAVCYGNYAIIIQDNYGRKWPLINLGTWEVEQNINVQQFDYAVRHNDCAIFSDHFYDENDYFPVLYVSTANNLIVAYRIYKPEGNDLFVCQELQQINVVDDIDHTGDEETADAIKYTAFDYTNKEFWSFEVFSHEIIFRKHTLPSIETGNTTLYLSNYSDTFRGYKNSGHTADAKLIYPRLYMNVSHDYINCYNLESKVYESKVQISTNSQGYSLELEGMFIYQGDLFVYRKDASSSHLPAGTYDRGIWVVKFNV